LLRMLDDEAYAIECLSHESAEERNFALCALDCFEIDNSALLPVFERMAFADPDPEIRLAALFSLALAAQPDPVKRREIGAKLARITLDKTEPDDRREAAYRALCSLPEDFDRNMDGLEPVQFPDGVDWKYVRTWLSDQ